MKLVSGETDMNRFGSHPNHPGDSIEEKARYPKIAMPCTDA
jgi:hypothetical protein